MSMVSIDDFLDILRMIYSLLYKTAENLWFFGNWHQLFSWYFRNKDFSNFLINGQQVHHSIEKGE